MKKLNDFFEKAPLWKIGLLSFVIIFTLFSVLVRLQPIHDISFARLNYMVAGVSFIFSLMMMGMWHTSNESQKFWKFSKEVEDLVSNAETKDQLKSIYENELQALNKMSFGRPHYGEIQKIVAIIHEKEKYVK